MGEIELQIGERWQIGFAVLGHGEIERRGGIGTEDGAEGSVGPQIPPPQRFRNQAGGMLGFGGSRREPVLAGIQRHHPDIHVCHITAIMTSRPTEHFCRADVM
jgi:hypothetical protein